MSTFIDRLKLELSDLESKINGLESFFDNDNFDKIDEVQKVLLRVQLKAMHTYKQCLNERISKLLLIEI